MTEQSLAIHTPVFDRLDAFKVNHWGSSSEEGGMSMVDRETASSLEEADVISSRLKFFDTYDQHIVVLDIDHLAHLIPSSTPGHSHLIVEIPPVSFEAYSEFLRAAAKIGLIEPGYAEVSIQRGHSDVRLPWVKKVQDNPNQEVPPL